MAILRRYEGRSTYESDRGDTYSHRYKREARNFKYTTLITGEPVTLDYLSMTQYGTPLLFWAIADMNDYLDPTITIPAGTEVKIPQL